MSPLILATEYLQPQGHSWRWGRGVATKLWTSSRLITMNLCMVGNDLISSKNYLEHCCNTSLTTHMDQRKSSRSRTQLEVRRGCGHQTLDIISSHHNESVQVGNALISSKNYLEHRCNALIKCPHSFWPQNICTLKDSVGGKKGVWPPNSGHHLVSSQQICAWLEILLLLSKTL